MKVSGPLLHPLFPAIFAFGLVFSQAFAADEASQAMPVVAQADCYSIGQEVAAQNGGTLARASSSSRDGQAVCVIVVLVPGKDGQRPRRAEFVVAQN